jgi:hypothetical protein
MRRKVRERQAESDRDGSEQDEAEEGTNAHAVLWTRRPVCGPRTEVIDRLSALQSAGELAGFDVETCPEEVAVSGQTRHSRVVEAYEQFRAWAVEAGVSVSPPFDRRTVTSLVGRTEEVLTVPVMCLAVYDDDLCGVYPCSDGDRTWTVTDYLDAYEAAESPPTLAELRDS